MKTTIDIPENVYRKVKAKSALEGRPVRDVAITLFSAWVDQPDALFAGKEEKLHKIDNQPVPPWFGSLRTYAHNARGQYDMDAIRLSIELGRARKKRPT